MTNGARIAIVVGVVLLALAQLFVPEDDPRLLEGTTRGTMPWGYRAAYDLLAELGYPVRRHEATVEQLPDRETAWWIAPQGICSDPGDEWLAGTWDAAPWALAGGTAVVWLSDTRAATRSCAIDALPVPSRAPPQTCEPATRGTAARDPHIPNLVTFTQAGDWTIRMEHRGQPFVLEHALGAGRVIVVADARPLQNEALDKGDAAPLVVDVVRAFGAPAIVEAPSPVPAAASRSVVRYLVHSPAAVPLAGLVLTGLLLAWRGGLVPPRTLTDDAAEPPTLQHFVDGLARLYAGTHDYARILARYRQLSASRLRRHLGLPAHATIDAIVERVGRSRPATNDPRALLDGPLRVATADDLRAAVDRLDALVAEVTG